MLIISILKLYKGEAMGRSTMVSVVAPVILFFRTQCIIFNFFFSFFYYKICHRQHLLRNLASREAKECLGGLSPFSTILYFSHRVNPINITITSLCILLPYPELAPVTMWECVISNQYLCANAENMCCTKRFNKGNMGRHVK